MPIVEAEVGIPTAKEDQIEKPQLDYEEQV